MSFFDELKRRNVFRVGVAYTVVAWLLLQVADIVVDNVNAPEWVMQIFMLALVLGLPLALFFAWAFELTPEGLKKEKDVDRTQSITQVTGRKLDYTIIALLTVGLLYFFWESRFSEQSTNANVTPAQAGIQTESNETADAGTSSDPGALDSDSNQASAAPPKSIAVLPFVNMSEDANNEYFSDGISEEILNALAKVKDLKVAGRTSSFAFKGQNQDLREIGSALNVSHILEGSVRKAGNQVRITAQLIKVDDGYHVWSENYDRELVDVFAIQDEIANAILDELKAHLIDSGDGATVTSTRADVAAYDLYLAAKEKIYQRTRASLEEANDMLTQALAIDAHYAPAYAQLGITTLLLSNQTYGETPLADSLERARPIIDKALELDPQQAEAYAALALFYNIQPGADPRNTIEAAEKALAINPNLTNARLWLRNGQMSMGNLREVRKLDAEISVRDPLYGPGFGNAVFSLLWSGQAAEAQTLIDRISPYLPDHPNIRNSQGSINIVQGLLAESVKVYSKAYLAAPTDAFIHGLYSSALNQANDYKTVVELGTPDERVIGLLMLDRAEEATVLAADLASSGEDVHSLLFLYAQQGQFDALLEFFESRWASVGEFDTEFPQRSGWGSYSLGHIAHAYLQTANEAKFQSAMSLFKYSLDRQREQGADNMYITFSEAFYHQLAGNEEQALQKLAEAIDRGLLTHIRISKQWPAFKSLEGVPEYDAIQRRMADHLNSERLNLGLEPLTT